MAFVNHFRSYGETSVKFVLAHSCFVEEVASTISHLSLYDMRVFLRWEVVINTCINHKKLKTMLTTEHINATATFSIVYHLLPSNLTRRK